MKRLLCLIVILIAFVSCKKVGLSHQKYTVLSYDELPIEVRDTIKSTSLIIFNVKYSENYFINLDKNTGGYELDLNLREGYGFGGVNPISVRFNDVEFVFDFSNVDGSKPFVLHNKKLYFGTTLNVYELNHVLENRYKMIDLSRYFNN